MTSKPFAQSSHCLPHQPHAHLLPIQISCLKSGMHFNSLIRTGVLCHKAVTNAIATSCTVSCQQCPSPSLTNSYSSQGLPIQYHLFQESFLSFPNSVRCVLSWCVCSLWFLLQSLPSCIENASFLVCVQLWIKRPQLAAMGSVLFNVVLPNSLKDTAEGKQTLNISLMGTFSISRIKFAKGIGKTIPN